MKINDSFWKFLYYILICVFLILTFTVFKDSIIFFYYSIKCTLNDIIYYFSRLFGFDFVVEKRPLDYLLEYTNGDYFSLLPIDWEVFKARFFSFFGVFVNKEYFVYYFYRFISKVGIYSRYIIIILLIILILFVLFRNYFKSNGMTGKSIYLINYEKFRDKVIDSIRAVFYSLYNFNKNNPKYLYFFIFILLLDFKLCSIVIDFIGLVFYFFSSYDFISIFEFIAAAFVYLSSILISIPLLFYFVIGYILFDKWRINSAFKELYHYENKNKGFIKSLGILTMFIGPPGVGKTQIITDISLSIEEIFRNDLLDILLDIRKRFSFFPFHVFEEELYYFIESKTFINRVQCSNYVNKKKQRFEYNNCRKKIYGYDYERYGLFFYDGKNNEYLWDALKDYAEAYFEYIMDCPLSVSNYAIRYDAIKEDYGYFPLWYYDYFNKDGRLIDFESRYSKVLDQDSLRLGKKLVRDNPNSFVLDCCVITHMEIGKERGNQYDVAEIKMSDGNANRKNDYYNKMLKVIRHLTTIRYKPFVMFIDDDQRSSSTNADLRELHDSIVTLKSSENTFETCIPLYWFLPGIIKFIISFLEKILLKFYNVRNDETLFIYFINCIVSSLYKFVIYRENMFDVKKIDLCMSSGLNNEDLGIKKYYLCKKKIFSNRYSTDGYSAFFIDKFLKNEKGFFDLDEYHSYITSLYELNKQNSYFVREIANIEDLKSFLD